jgi:hypothetical protein
MVQSLIFCNNRRNSDIIITKERFLKFCTFFPEIEKDESDFKIKSYFKEKYLLNRKEIRDQIKSLAENIFDMDVDVNFTDKEEITVFFETSSEKSGYVFYWIISYSNAYINGLPGYDVEDVTFDKIVDSDNDMASFPINKSFNRMERDDDLQNSLDTTNIADVSSKIVANEESEINEDENIVKDNGVNDGDNDGDNDGVDKDVGDNGNDGVEDDEEYEEESESDVEDNDEDDDEDNEDENSDDEVDYKALASKFLKDQEISRQSRKNDDDDIDYEALTKNFMKEQEKPKKVEDDDDDIDYQALAKKYARDQKMNIPDDENLKDIDIELPTSVPFPKISASEFEKLINYVPRKKNIQYIKATENEKTDESFKSSKKLVPRAGFIEHNHIIIQTLEKKLVKISVTDFDDTTN